MVWTRAIAMVSDHEIASCVEPLLRQSDPATASLAGVVRRIEAKLGFDLSHKVAAFIRDQIELLLGSSHRSSQAHFLRGRRHFVYLPQPAQPRHRLPPLPSAAVVAAYNLQQQLHQVAQEVPTAVRPVTVSAATQKER
ncbi:hypothetical protein OPV22_025036 [Ensete ventricosum]|uniref:DEK-C domain-containing protein n=1 Tax=Ensete ventricosum TaxID=4639 RepID=A0AAV8QIG0_ENSVE|nr:hypothetical protein OPV22_025036 [Ensete ventricosum]